MPLPVSIKPREYAMAFFALLSAIFFGQAVVATVTHFSPNSEVYKIIIMWSLMFATLGCYTFIMCVIPACPKIDDEVGGKCMHIKSKDDRNLHHYTCITPQSTPERTP